MTNGQIALKEVLQASFKTGKVIYAFETVNHIYGARVKADGVGETFFYNKVDGYAFHDASFDNMVDALKHIKIVESAFKSDQRQAGAQDVYAKVTYICTECGCTSASSEICTCCTAPKALLSTTTA